MTKKYLPPGAAQHDSNQIRFNAAFSAALPKAIHSSIPAIKPFDQRCCR
jgi:hypothetical protein